MRMESYDLAGAAASFLASRKPLTLSFHMKILLEVLFTFSFGNY